MATENTILTEIKGSTATIWLNRPEKRNALDIEMLSGFLPAIKFLNSSDAIRIIVIRGKGISFCAGADLNWMQRSFMLTGTENLSECETLAACFYELYHSSKIVISLIHGSCIGGGNGFVAASDIVIAGRSSVFAFSEVLLGLVPASILPYVITKIGRAGTMELMLTGNRFSAEDAMSLGFVNHVCNEPEMEDYLSGVTNQVLKGAPLVQKIIKTRLRDVESPFTGQALIKESAALLAQVRTTPEAREGINAFFEKREPIWCKKLP
jgi:methylglutaconyl-CoA hydratase